MIDLRSDTVTRPTAAMRDRMAAAFVGDDVMGDDPTVRQLEEATAELLGKPAALFVPSGTMSNQLGVRVHCQAGEELICDTQCHIYHYEQAAYAQLWGVSARPIDTVGGIPTVDELNDAIQADNIHFPTSKVLCLENTHNRWGGRLASLDQVREVCAHAATRGLARHLDGARIWNAAVAADKPWREALLDWSEPFDTLSVCFSKGLGAPVGSALAGSNEAIAKAKRVRKALGGGMRQAGIIAAGALYALEHHVDRLAEDHRRARRLAEAIDQMEGFSLVDDRCDTNLVLFNLDPSFGNAADFASHMAEQGVQFFASGPQRFRLVTHLDINDEAIEETIEIFQSQTASAKRSRTNAAVAY